MSDNTKMSIDAKAHLVEGYGATDAAAKRRRKLAASFIADPMFERLIAQPELLEQMSAHTRIALGIYTLAKEAFEAKRKVKA